MQRWWCWWWHIPKRLKDILRLIWVHHYVMNKFVRMHVSQFRERSTTPLLIAMVQISIVFASDNCNISYVRIVIFTCPTKNKINAQPMMHFSLICCFSFYNFFFRRFVNIVIVFMGCLMIYQYFFFVFYLVFDRFTNSIRLYAYIIK